MNALDKRMRARPLACGATLLLALLPVAAALAQTSGSGARSASPVASLRIIETAVEALASDLSLPLTEAGSVTVRSCPTCRSVALLTGSRARYTLDGETLSLQELRRALLAAPATAVVVLYARGGTEITRIVATSPSAATR
jgi:hypothetical protein